MVHRIYVEKKDFLRQEAAGLLAELKTLLGIEALEEVRLINRYDMEGLDEATFRRAVENILSEPQVDDVYDALPADGYSVFAVEPLPGQFDQRADSAAQCVQLLTGGERPAVLSAKVYMLRGALSEGDVAKVKAFLINPVETREASLDTFETLKVEYAVPTAVETLDGSRRPLAGEFPRRRALPPCL